MDVDTIEELYSRDDHQLDKDVIDELYTPDEAAENFTHGLSGGEVTFGN